MRELRPEASNHHEHDNHHPSTGYHHKGEDVVESNAPSRQTRSEDEQPYEPEVVNAWWEAKMRAMKNKMDLMMNAMKGWMTTLNNLVHHNDSPFTLQVISCPLLPKFLMPWKSMTVQMTLLIILSLLKPLCISKAYQTR